VIVEVRMADSLTDDLNVAAAEIKRVTEEGVVSTWRTDVHPSWNHSEEVVQAEEGHWTPEEAFPMQIKQTIVQVQSHSITIHHDVHMQCD